MNMNAIIETLDVKSEDFIKLYSSGFRFDEELDIEDFEKLLNKHISEEIDKFARVNIINILSYKLLNAQLSLNKLREANYPSIDKAERKIKIYADRLEVYIDGIY